MLSCRSDTSPEDSLEEQRIIDDLPELYHRLFPKFFQEKIPRETLATCSDCAMRERPGHPVLPGQEFFRPDIKCCTFHPKLPNFLIGGLLLDTNPGMEYGRQVIREKIRRRAGVAPSCILPDRKYALIHGHGGERVFGKNVTLMCPYYVIDTGLCSIWKFREAVCSTYFCKCSAGKEGKVFWNVLRAYLIQAQDALTWYSLLQLGRDVEPIWDYLSDYGNERLDERDVDLLAPDEALYRKLWGDLVGHEEEFYIRTFEVVSELTAEDFDRISGMSIRIFESWLKRRHKEVVAPVLPAVMRANPELIAAEAPDGTFAIKTEAGYYTIDRNMWNVLSLFDGRRTSDEIRGLAQEKWNMPAPEEQLIWMYQNRLIVPA